MVVGCGGDEVITPAEIITTEEADTPESATETPTDSTSDTTDTTDTTSEDTPVASSATKGTLYVGITDDAFEVDQLRQIDILIGNLRVVAAEGEPFSVDMDNKQFDLLQLKKSGVPGFIGKIELDAGTYPELQMIISDVKVDKGGGDMTAKMPLKIMNMVGDIVIVPGQDSVVVIDFLADKSMHLTGQGRMIFAPVVAYESTKQASVQVSGKQLLIGTGSLVVRKELGMNTDGSFTVGGGIAADTPLSWENNRLVERVIETESKRLSSSPVQGQGPAEDFTAGSYTGRRFGEGATKTPFYEECVERCKESCMGSACKGCETKCY
jgi:hypothetical protein